MFNVLAGVFGLIGVLYASAHGVQSGVGLVATFLLTFVATAVLLRYLKQIIGIAVLGFGLYEIIHYFAVR